MEVTDPLPAVAGIAAVLAAALWWLRKKGALRFEARRNRTGRRLESLERLALSPQHTLHLVRLDGAAILVAQSPAGLTLLSNPANTAPRRAMAETA